MFSFNLNQISGSLERLEKGGISYVFSRSL